MDLLDWHRGRLSSRRLAVLIRHMPSDSSLARELHGEAADWSVTDHLLAAAVDHLAVSNWMFATINRDEDAEPLDPPEPIARPEASDASASAEAVQTEPAKEAASHSSSPVELQRFFS